MRKVPVLSAIVPPSGVAVFAAALLAVCCTQTDRENPPRAAAEPPAAVAQRPPAPAPAVPRLEEGTRIVPVDEALNDPSFHAFRTELQSIVRRRDSAALLKFVDPQVRVSFGVENGIDELERRLKSESAATDLWMELGELLALGGAFDEAPDGTRRFVAPYAFARWPESGDPFELLAAVCPNVTVHAAPDEKSSALVTLDWNVLAIGKDDPVREGEKNPQWRQIVLPDGRNGWVEARCMRSGVDYRAAFEKKGGEWKMMYFVAGD